MKGSSLIGFLEDGFILGTSGMAGWDMNSWVWVGGFPVDGEIMVRFCRESE